MTAAAGLPGGAFHLIAVHLDGLGGRVTDEGLRHLRGLPHLQTPAWLTSPKSSHSGRSLMVNGTRVTEAGLARLRAMPTLRILGAGTADSLAILG